MKTIDEILDFINNHDFPFVYVKGLQFANNSQDKEFIINFIKDNSVLFTEVTLLEEEASGCTELKTEINNECIVYKFWKNNESPLYIALY